MKPLPHQYSVNASAEPEGNVRLDATVEGVLARVQHTTRFTELTVHATLEVEAPDIDREKALRLLEKAEKTCLVTNSLAVPVKLEARVVGNSSNARKDLCS